MRTTADARELFREIDATGINSGSYEFNYTTERGRVAIKPEGEAFDRTETDVQTKTVYFEDFPTKEHEMKLARDALVEEAEAHLAGTPLDESFDYDTLYIDRVGDKAYLVDTSRFGYCAVNEEAEGDGPMRGGYVGLYGDAAVRVR
jgi:hypothetical protein